MHFDPTEEQKALIDHNGSAFVSACPGAGKTRCIVERARKILSERNDHRGIAFLSFTNAAVSELEERLTKEGLLPMPPFPNFVGTFDSFIWHFMVVPFGLAGCDEPLRLIPDTDSLMIEPYPKAQPLPLKCFDRATGVIIAEEAMKFKFGGNRNPRAHQTAAARLRARLRENGHLDFSDARLQAHENLQSEELSKRLACILSARFKEIVVDEAQDCNPEDLAIIEWLRAIAGIATKVICDPHQSIYGFRGGVAEHLFQYEKCFPEQERLPLTGNFRSTDQICKAVHSLRAPSNRGVADEALGPAKSEEIAVHVISYSGQGVSPEIGTEFQRLVEAHDMAPEKCPLVAKVRQSALRAVGLYGKVVGQSLSQRLALAAMNFHHAEHGRDRLEAVRQGHEVALALAGKTSERRTYHQALAAGGIEDLGWRGQIVKKLGALDFDATQGQTRAEWLRRAHDQFGAYLPAGDATIARRLRNEASLDEILVRPGGTSVGSRTIHSVKGLEFPGICVVLTPASANRILTHLEREPDQANAETTRELYVAASRAERLLVLACSRNQTKRLMKHLAEFGVRCEMTEI